MNLLDTLSGIFIGAVLLCFIFALGGSVLFAIYLIFSKRDGGNK